MLTASVAMWAASESSASESATNAVTISTTTNTAVSTKANQSRPTFLAAVRRMASEWSCAPRVGVGTRRSHRSFSPSVRRPSARAAIMRIMLNSPAARPDARSDVVLAADGRVVLLRQRTGAVRREHRRAQRASSPRSPDRTVRGSRRCCASCSACSRPTTGTRRAVRHAPGPAPRPLAGRVRPPTTPHRARPPGDRRGGGRRRSPGEAGLVAPRAAPSTARPSTTRSSRCAHRIPPRGGSASCRAASSSAR